MEITDKQLDQFLNDSVLSYDYEEDSLRVVRLYFYEKNGNLVDIIYNSQDYFEVIIWEGENEIKLTDNQFNSVYKKITLAFNLQVHDDREYFYNQRYESDSTDDSYYIH